MLEIPPPLVWTAFSLPPASISIVELEELPDGRAVPRCLGLADVGHLEDGTSPPDPIRLNLTP